MTRLPIVLVHGIRLSGTCWSAVTEHLAPERPVATMDLPGHGARRGERFTLAAAVDAVHQAIDRSGGRALLVGHSLGGFVSVAAAACDPDRVAGLVVAGASFPPNRAVAIPFTVMHKALSSRPDGGERFSSRVFDRALPTRVSHDIARGGIATEVIPDVLAALTEFDLTGHLGRYPGPVWLVNGSHDHFRLGEQRCLKVCEQGRLVTVPRAGHYFPLAEPVAFSRLVMDTAAACDHRYAGCSGSGRASVRYARGM